MDPVRFDTLAKSLSAGGTRRGLVRLLAALPLGVTLIALLDDAPDVTAKKGGGKKGPPKGDDDHGSSHRQHRRKAKHRHQAGNHKEHRKGKRKGKDTGTDAGTAQCTKRSCSAGSCGSQPDGCGGTMQCGGCASNQLCFDNRCRTCDVCQLPAVCDFTSVRVAVETTTRDPILVCPGDYAEASSNPNFGLEITRNLRLIGVGDGESPTTNTHLRPAASDSGVVSVQYPGIEVTLEGLRLTGGGGIIGSGLTMANGPRVTVRNTTIANNTSSNSAGGAFVAHPGTELTVINSRITGNTGLFAGGIEVSEAAVFLDSLSRVTGNTATVGNGGIFNNGGTVDLPSVDNVSGNFSTSPTNPDCGGTGPYTGAGAICTNP